MNFYVTWCRMMGLEETLDIVLPRQILIGDLRWRVWSEEYVIVANGKRVNDKI